MKKILAILLMVTLTLSLSLSVALAEEKRTVTLWHRWSGNNEAILKEVVEAFEAQNPDIRVEITGKSGQYFDLLQQMLADAAAGLPRPDVFVGGYNLLNYIATEMNPVPSNELAPSEEAYAEMAGRFPGEVLALGAYDGVQVGLPFALSNMVMYVNMDIFGQAGLTEADIPATWEEVEKVSQIIIDRTDHYAVGIQMSDNWTDQALIYSAGGSLLTEDKQRVAFDGEGGVKAYTLWQGLMQKGYAPICTDQELNANFMAGDVAMNCTTNAKLAGYQSSVAFEMKVVESPAFAGHEKKLPAGGAALVSFTSDENRRADVWRLMDYMLSEEGMRTFVKTGYVCTTNAEVPVSEGQEASYAQTRYAMPWACWPGGSTGLEIDSLFLSGRTELLHSNLNVQEKLTQMAEECNALLGD